MVTRWLRNLASTTVLGVVAIGLVAALLVAAVSAWTANENLHHLQHQRDLDAAAAEQRSREADADRARLVALVQELQRENRALRRYFRRQGIDIPPAGRAGGVARSQTSQATSGGGAGGSSGGGGGSGPPPGHPSSPSSPSPHPHPHPTPSPSPSCMALPLISGVCIPPIPVPTL